LEKLHNQLSPKHISCLREEAIKRNYSETTLAVIDDLKGNPLAFTTIASQTQNTLAEVMGINIETGTKALIKLYVDE
jgi:hypothetical protein